MRNDSTDDVELVSNLAITKGVCIVVERILSKIYIC